MMTLLSWITAFLLIGATAADQQAKLNHFPENFAVAKQGKDSVSLTCLTTTTGPVTWKHNNDEESDFKDNMSQSGHNLTVRDVEAPLLGEYSCWRDGTKLSSTLLLQETEEEEDINSLLTCRAKSYDCNFSCRWTEGRYGAVRLGIGPDCTNGLPTCHWVSSSAQPDSEGFQFELTHNLSSFGEESTMLEVTAEAIDDDFLFLKKTKKFYLRDIVVPDSPRIVSMKVVQSQLNVSIEPPSSWSTPHSFFALEHEIEYILRDNGETIISSSSLIPKKISKLRARSRDPLVFSTWSQWTPWKNWKNSCQCRKKQTSELSPKCLEHCKRKMERRRTEQSQNLLK
ncbi:interleukin-12 subunit beta isoform X1 [Poecilia latipinna]|uniref:interleukin-12 subunit beta isoform X1 n=2 Tax=Poecilia latipinna TaxID=48699 RepID=UPI00072EB01E|nr:PREDICTED: interleukin-12 subunit beta-like isoform X1 [Poecilia latipinna]